MLSHHEPPVGRLCLLCCDFLLPSERKTPGTLLVRSQFLWVGLRMEAWTQSVGSGRAHGHVSMPTVQWAPGAPPLPLAGVALPPLTLAGLGPPRYSHIRRAGVGASLTVLGAWQGKGGPGRLMLSSHWERAAVRPGTTFENIPYVFFPNWSHDPFPKSRQMFPGRDLVAHVNRGACFPRQAGRKHQLRDHRREKSPWDWEEYILGLCVWVSSAQK